MSEARPAFHAIDESLTSDSIVMLEWTEVAERDLDAECDGTADRGHVIEFWGSDRDGDQWRVHLKRSANA